MPGLSKEEMAVANEFSLVENIVLNRNLNKENIHIRTRVDNDKIKAKTPRHLNIRTRIGGIVGSLQQYEESDSYESGSSCHSGKPRVNFFKKKTTIKTNSSDHKKPFLSSQGKMKLSRLKHKLTKGIERIAPENKMTDKILMYAREEGRDTQGEPTYKYK